MMMIITRYFSSTTWGELGTFNSIAAILIAIAAGRFDLAIMLEHDDRAAKVLVQLSFRIIVAVSVLGGIISWLLRPILAEHYSEAVARWMPLIGVSTLFTAGATMLQYWYNRKTDYKTIARNRIERQVGSSGGQVVCGWLGIITLPGLLFGQLIGQVYAFFNLSRKASDLRALDTKGAPTMGQLARKHWKMPVLNGPNVLVDSVRTNGINLLIGSISIASLGQYLLAYQAVQVPVTLINSAVSQVFFQKLSLVRPGAMFAEVRRAIKRATLIGIGPFALLYWLAPWIFPIVFGSGWEDAGYFARALIPWLFFNLITSPISNMFVVTGTQHWLLGFAILYCVAPLTWLSLSPYPLLETTYVLGAIMAGCLLCMTGLSLLAARRFDRRSEPVAND
ncbi:MAG: oligosaccharide flippase family protein [Bowdeniella nasicola]|nr:oligosaccharide flippase family protein [Bowdeniella nasicola]